MGNSRFGKKEYRENSMYKLKIFTTFRLGLDGHGGSLFLEKGISGIIDMMW